MGEYDEMLQDWNLILNNYITEYCRISDLLDDMGYGDDVLIAKYHSLAVSIADCYIQIKIIENELTSLTPETPRNI